MYFLCAVRDSDMLLCRNVLSKQFDSLYVVCNIAMCGVRDKFEKCFELREGAGMRNVC